MAHFEPDLCWPLLLRPKFCSFCNIEPAFTFGVSNTTWSWPRPAYLTKPVTIPHFWSHILWLEETEEQREKKEIRLSYTFPTAEPDQDIQNSSQSCSRNPSLPMKDVQASFHVHLQEAEGSRPHRTPDKWQINRSVRICASLPADKTNNSCGWEIVLCSQQQLIFLTEG